MVRNGIALIELIIAIIVMAIAFMAVPTMMEIGSKASSLVIHQEAIALASTQMNTVDSLQWDEKNTMSDGYVKILDVVDNSNARASFGYGRYPNIGSVYRIGTKTMHADQRQYRRKFENIQTYATTTLGSEEGSDSADFDDIDDYNNFSYSVSEQSATGYKFPYTIDINVSYRNNDITNDAAPGGSSNVKEVSIRIHEATNGTDIRLKAFFCNIGETKILIKPIP